MPSPLGHALGGFACGWLVAGPPPAHERGPGATDRPRPESPSRRVALFQAGIFAALGTAADLDLLIGRHSQFTHSIGMAASVGLLAYLLLAGRRRAALLALAAAAAYASHILLDWLGQDATPPFGITALWPFTSVYYLSPVQLFWGISREPWRPGAALHDVVAISREVMLLAPPAVAAWWLRRRDRRRPVSQLLPDARVEPVQHLPGSARGAAGSESQ